MSALADEIKAALREVLREELPRALANLRPPADGEFYVGVDEAARRLGLSTSTVYKLAERIDELPSVKVGTKVLFKVADLLAYAEKRRRSPERVDRLAKQTYHPHNVIRNGADDQGPKAEPDSTSLKRE